MKKYTKILSLIAVLICIVFMSGCAKNITVEYQIDDTVITTQQYAKNNKIKLYFLSIDNSLLWLYTTLTT